MKQLNKNIEELRPSATLAINERSAKLMAAGRKIYRLGFGQSPFPVPFSVVESLKNAAEIKDYLPVRGLPRLREAVSIFNKKALNIDCSSTQILIGPGSKELIFNAQMALDADLLLPSPSWVSYEPQAHLARQKVIWIDTKEVDGWRLLPENLEKVCIKNPNRQKLLILNYPNNPVGTTYSKEQLKAIAQVAQKHQIIIIADEIYGEVHHSGEHISLAHFYPEGTIISSGLSKWAGAGGWRLGTFTFPKELDWLQNAMAVIASETYTSVSAPIQYAAVTAFEGSTEIEEYLRASRTILKQISRYVYQKLMDINISMPPSQGGFYLFPNFGKHRDFLTKKGISNNEELCEVLLQEIGIALLPGIAFGRPKEELTARLSFVDFDGAKALAIYQKEPETKLNDEILISLFPNIKESMEVLKNWLEK